MLDPTPPVAEPEAPAFDGYQAARDRSEARARAVQLVRRDLEEIANAKRPESAAVRLLLDTYDIEHAAATVWRSMYFTVEHRLNELDRIDRQAGLS